MVIQKEFTQILTEFLKGDNPLQFEIGGYRMTMSLSPKSKALVLSTPVYFGGNFIPKSVRSCIKAIPPFRSHMLITTFFTVDEEEFRIDFNYEGDFKNLSDEKFKLILEEYQWLADKWRLLLDEHDKNDLVYVRK